MPAPLSTETECTITVRLTYDITDAQPVVQLHPRRGRFGVTATDYEFVYRHDGTQWQLAKAVVSGPARYENYNISPGNRRRVLTFTPGDVPAAVAELAELSMPVVRLAGARQAG